MKIPVKIDDVHYEVDEAVVKRMQEYYDTMLIAVREYKALGEATHSMRRLQIAYFSNRSPDVMKAAKGAERKVDDLLAGKKQKEKEKQQELF